MSNQKRLLVLVCASPALFAMLGALPSCGARTQLLVSDASPQPPDTTPLPDVVDEPDAIDEPEVADTLPPIDIVPPPDVIPFCTDPSVLSVYVVTEHNELLSFEPPSASFRSIGTIRCPARTSATPFSMAVDHTGHAYVVFSDGELFSVSVKDASCKATKYVSPGGDFTTFGMGFARETDGTETLYIAGAGASNSLGRINIPSYTVDRIAKLSTSVKSPELTGTGAGQLFGFFTNADVSDGSAAIAEFDKTTAALKGRVDLPTVFQGTGWAFAFWGGDFYMFTAPRTTTGSIVQRYRPKDGSVVQVAAWPSVIVGAGVSTCAPGG